jgi:hypothetical protein
MNGRRRLALFYSPADKVGRLYWRELPGGGYVALDVHEDSSQPGGGFVGRITVERRAEQARRNGCTPPVIAELRANTTGMLLHQLLPIARSNPAIGAALLHTGTVTHGP